MTSLPLLLDRLANASDGSDARDTLTAMDDLLTDLIKTPTKFNNVANELLGDYSFIENSFSLITNGTLVSNVNVNEGESAAATLFITLFTHSLPLYTRTSLAATLLAATLYNNPLKRDRNIIPCLLDLLANDNADTYSRTLAVQLLTTLHSLKSADFESTLIATPSGLNTLTDLLATDVDESVRNEVVLLLTEMSTISPSVRKLVTFSEGFDRLFEIIKAEDGLTGGSIVVQDCLNLAKVLAREDGGTFLFQSQAIPTVLLPELLDVSKGQEFVYRRNGRTESQDREDDDHIAELLGKTPTPKNMRATADQASLTPPEEKVR